MLKRATLLLLTCTITLFSGCAEEKITPNAKFDFKSPEEQRQFEKRALAGDIVAARRLADYYMLWHYDKQKALYWMRVAARHGDKVSKENIRTITQGN
jgi:TPR repeat protein